MAIPAIYMEHIWSTMMHKRGEMSVNIFLI